jgi:hypothetical protein
MWWSIIIFLSFSFLYLLQERYYKKIYQEIVLYIGISLLMVNVLSRRDNSESFSPTEALFAISIVLLLSFLFYMLSRTHTKEIVAKQVSYWGVPFELILSKNKHKIVSKRGRYELEEQKKEYFYEEVFENNKKTRRIQPLVLADIKSYRGFTIIESLNYFESQSASILYQAIYVKLYTINEDIETEIEFDKLLKMNKYCVEFFLIDLWREISSKEIIGIGTLNAYAKNKKELELIGAFDAAVSSNVKKQGILLYAHYLNFKGELNHVT